MGCGASKPPARQDPYPEPQASQAPQEQQQQQQAAPAAAAAPDPAPLSPESTPLATTPAPPAPTVVAPAPAVSSWDDWDDDDDASSAPTRSQPPPTAVAGATPQPTEHAAFRNGSGALCIGAVAAAAMELGLRCTACGQRVHRFEAHLWDESADYYTFRNYVRIRRPQPRPSAWPATTPSPQALRLPLRTQAPDERMPHKRQEDLSKLARWLRPATSASGGAAYACGCSWQSTVGREAKPIEGEGEGEGEGVLAAPHGGARLGEAEPRLKWVAV